MATTPIRSFSPPQHRALSPSLSPAQNPDVAHRTTVQPEGVTPAQAARPVSRPSSLRPSRFNFEFDPSSSHRSPPLSSQPSQRRIRINEANNQTMLIPSRRDQALEVIREARDVSAMALITTTSTSVPLAASGATFKAMFAAQAASQASSAAEEAFNLAPKVATCTAHAAIYSARVATSVVNAGSASSPQGVRDWVADAEIAADVARSAAYASAQAADCVGGGRLDVDQVARSAAQSALSASRAAIQAVIQAKHFALRLPAEPAR